MSKVYYLSVDVIIEAESVHEAAQMVANVLLDTVAIECEVAECDEAPPLH